MNIRIMYLGALFLLITSIPSFAQSQYEEAIEIAVLAAPEDLRAEATVYVYNANNELVMVREGNNEFVCLGENPSRERFEVACYHESLEPFMARGRELRMEGKNSQEVFEIREAEAVSGQLSMPEEPATLYIYFGESGNYDSENQVVEGARYRYVVYVPFADQKSTGLPLRPGGAGHPWLMSPGTHAAHIMITPPAVDN